MDSRSEAELDLRLRELLAEDAGGGDVTTDATVAEDARARGTLIARSGCVVSGLPVARRVFELLDPSLAWRELARAGSRVEEGTELATLSGSARAILTAERVSLNLLQRMCGIATLTRRFVDAVAGTGCRILDTRKTAPGLRRFDRQAVRDGGGVNHRFNLSDMILIKDNHRAFAGGVGEAVAAARRSAPEGMPIEVEVESEEQLLEALDAGARRILIDNQPPSVVRRWVKAARERSPGCFIEASGGVTLENARAYAEAGADAVSIGALTHSAPAADVSLEVEPA